MNIRIRRNEENKIIDHHIIIDKIELLLMRKTIDYYTDHNDIGEDTDIRSFIDDIYNMVDDYEEEERENKKEIRKNELEIEILNLNLELENL